MQNDRLDCNVLASKGLAFKNDGQLDQALQVLGCTRIYRLFMGYSWVIHGLCMGYSWVIRGLFKECIILMVLMVHRR